MSRPRTGDTDLNVGGTGTEAGVELNVGGTGTEAGDELEGGTGTEAGAETSEGPGVIHKKGSDKSHSQSWTSEVVWSVDRQYSSPKDLVPWVDVTRSDQTGRPRARKH